MTTNTRPTPIRYALRVENGTQERMVYPLSDGSIVIGSCSQADLYIADPGITPEHVRVIMSKENVWIENLSSHGTYLSDQAVEKKALLVPGEEFVIGEGIRIRLISSQPKENNQIANIVFPILLIFLLVGAFMIEEMKMHEIQVEQRPIDEDDWIAAYDAIHKRLQAWQKQGKISADYVDVFEQAWFREQSGDTDTALQLWGVLFNNLTELSIPGVTPPGQTVATASSNDSNALTLTMGRDRTHDLAQENIWQKNDQAYANAFWWFVSGRIEQLRKQDKAQ